MKAARRVRSPKKNATAATRAPRRCRKCPNRPLKSTCGCLKQGGVVQNTESSSTLNLAPVPPTVVSTASGPQILSGLVASLPIPLDGRYDSGLFQHQLQGTSRDEPSPGEPVSLDRPADLTTSPTAALQNMLCQSPGEPVGLDRPADPTTSPTAALGRLTPPSPDNGNQEIPIDPALLIEPESRIPGPATVEATEIEDDDGHHNHTPDGIQKSAGGRLTAAEKVERNGLVEGAMRGNMVYSIARQNQTRRVLSHASSATTRYNRELPLIISRAERLAIETDAYILLVAQQATGSSATIHFTSERLRREAFDESGNLINQFQELMTHLVLAKRSTTLALVQNLDASEKARLAVMERLEDREAELAASRRANEELVAELEAIRNGRGHRNE